MQASSRLELPQAIDRRACLGTSATGINDGCRQQMIKSMRVKQVEFRMTVTFGILALLRPNRKESSKLILRTLIPDERGMSIEQHPVGN